MLPGTRPRTTTQVAVSALASLAAGGTLAGVAMLAHNTELATGILVGVGIALPLVLGLIVRARREDAPTAARLVTGQGDERERRLVTRAAARAAVTMFAAATATALAAAFGLSAAGSIAIIMWTGLATVAISFLVDARRA